MKITSKQIYTTVILDDGTYRDMVKKTVTIDATFDSMDVDEIHNIIAIALHNRIQAVKTNADDSDSR